MVNIWPFQYKKNVKITDVDGDVFIGEVVCCTDVEEQFYYDEDSLTLDVNGKYIGFGVSEIKNIEFAE